MTNSEKPLAYQIRPTKISDVVGQEELTSPDSALNQLIKNNLMQSIILYGPSGTGKTSLAEVIANEAEKNFVGINATNAKKKDMETVPKDGSTLLFIDEIHRFSKAQQDYLLPFVESGDLILIGATTGNPYFEVNKALISRSILFKLEPLNDEALGALIKKGLTAMEPKIGIDYHAATALITMAGKDGRRLLNLLELTHAMAVKDKKDAITIDEIKKIDQTTSPIYDKDEEHYNTISALIKSIRGSDPNAAIYYLARMLHNGEPIEFITRRLMILASEDIGLAEPEALTIATNADYAARIVGLPEARIILAEAVLFLALCPKSNSSYMAIDKTLDYVKNNSEEIPHWLKDRHYKGAEALLGPSEYHYPFDYPQYQNIYPINYLPANLCTTQFWAPGNLGRETDLVTNLQNKLAAIAQRENQNGR